MYDFLYLLAACGGAYGAAWLYNRRSEIRERERVNKHKPWRDDY